MDSWELTLDSEGHARQTLRASAPGQYRLSVTIDDGQGHTIEGGYLLVVQGPGFDGGSFRFNELEIIPDKKDYRPGDTLRLQINTNQVDSTVLILALVVIVIGGLGSVRGALVGALVVGQIDTFGRQLLQQAGLGELTSFVLFGALALVLVLRPQGLFGARSVGRAA